MCLSSQRTAPSISWPFVTCFGMSTSPALASSSRTCSLHPSTSRFRSPSAPVPISGRSDLGSVLTLLHQGGVCLAHGVRTAGVFSGARSPKRVVLAGDYTSCPPSRGAEDFEYRHRPDPASRCCRPTPAHTLLRRSVAWRRRGGVMDEI